MLPAFSEAPVALALWIRIETEDARAVLQRVTSSDAQWRATRAPLSVNEGLDDSVDASDAATPTCAVLLTKHIDTQVKRIALLPSEAVQGRFVREIVAPLLEQFTAQIRARVAMVAVGARDTGNWADAGGLAHVLAYAAPRVAEWQESAPLVGLARAFKPPATTPTLTPKAPPTSAPADPELSSSTHTASSGAADAGGGAGAGSSLLSTPKTLAGAVARRVGQTASLACTSASLARTAVSTAASMATSAARAGLASPGAAAPAPPPRAAAEQGVDGAEGDTDGADGTPAAADHAAQAAAPELVFSALLREWAASLAELEATVRDTVISDFAASSRAYVAQRRDFRLAASAAGQADASIHLDLSAALCEPTSRLHAELHGLRQSLPAASLRRVWPPIAAAVDELLYNQMVRRSTFSEGGARQLRRDVAALVALFQPFTPTPHAHLRRMHESVQLLTLDAPVRRSLAGELLGDTPPQPQREEHEAALRRRLELSAGVFRLTLGEAVEVLTSLVEDEHGPASSTSSP